MQIDIEALKKLRITSGASIADCRMVLEESKGDYQKALKLINIKGLEKAAKKSERETKQGLIDSYIHQNGRVGVLLEILCETDFVARTEDFKKLAHEVSMQVAAMNPKDVEGLLKQEYIRDPSKTIETFIKETIVKLGENIKITRFQRFELGK